MEHTHFSPLGMDHGHTDREHRTLSFRGRLLGGRRQETGGKAEGQAEVKKDNAEKTEKTKPEQVKDKKDNFAKRISAMEDRLQKLSEGKGTKEITDKVKRLKETMEKSLEDVEREIKDVEDSVTALVQKLEEGSESKKYNERRQKVLPELRKLASARETTPDIKKVADTYIASLKDPETRTMTNGAQITEALVQKPQDLKDAEEFVKNPKAFVEKQKQKESSNKSDQTVDTARDEAFTKGREEARKTFEQRTFDAVQGENWKFIKEGEGAPKEKGFPTLYRQVTIQGTKGEETYMVSYNPKEESKTIGVYIYDPKTLKWVAPNIETEKAIVAVVGTTQELQNTYTAKRAEADADGTYATSHEQNDRNRVVGNYVRSGTRADFNPKSDAWQGNEAIQKIISDALAVVDRKEAQEIDVIADRINNLTNDIETTKGSLPEIESSIAEINKLLKVASPSTLKAVGSFSVDGFVKPNPNSPYDYKYVRVAYKDGALVIEKDEKKSNEYNNKLTTLSSAKSRLDQALSTHDEAKIRSAVQTLSDVVKKADRTVFTQLDPFNLQGTYAKGDSTIRFSLQYENGKLSMSEDTLQPEQQKQFQALLAERFDATVTVTLGEQRDSYMITAPSLDIEKVRTYAEKRGMNPEVADGKVTVTVTKFDPRLKFTGPGFRETDKDGFLRVINTWRSNGDRPRDIEQSITDINRCLPSLTQEAYDTAQKTVLKYSTGTISFVNGQFVFIPNGQKIQSAVETNPSPEKPAPQVDASITAEPSVAPDQPTEATSDKPTAEKPAPQEKPAPSASEVVEKSRVVTTSEDYELKIDNAEAVTEHLRFRFLQKYEKLEEKSTENTYINTTVGPIGKDAHGNNMYRISCSESNDDVDRTMSRLLDKAKKHGLVAPDATVSGAHQFDITVTGYERGFGYTGPYARQTARETPDKPTADIATPRTVTPRKVESPVVTTPRPLPKRSPVATPDTTVHQTSVPGVTTDMQLQPSDNKPIQKQETSPTQIKKQDRDPEAKPSSATPYPTSRNTDAENTAPQQSENVAQNQRRAESTQPNITTPTTVEPERMPEYRASSLPPKPVEAPGEKRIVAPGKILAKEAKVKREAVTKAVVEQQRASLEAQEWKYNPTDDSYSVDSKGSFKIRYNPKKECWEVRENGGRYDYLQQWKTPDGTNVFSPIYKKTAEGIQAMNRALILTPTQIDQATGTEIDPQTNITSEELDGLRRDLVHLQSVRENREKDYDATYQSSRGIVDALIAEIDHIRQNPALIRENVVTQKQYDALIDKAKVYADRNNMLVEMTKSMPDTKAKVLSSVRSIHESLMKRIDEMIRVREQDMQKKSDELRNSSLFQSWHQGLTGSSPLQIEIDTLNSEVTNLRSVKRQMQYGGIKEDGPITRKDISEKIEKAQKSEYSKTLPGSAVLNRKLKQDIEANAREDVGATLDSLLRIRTLLQTINKVDADAGRKYEEDLEGIEVSKDVAVAIITLPAGAGGKATTLAGRVVSGARIGGLVSGSMSAKENYEEVQAGRKTVEQAVKGVAQDTTVGVGGGAAGGIVGHGLSKVKLPTRAPSAPRATPSATPSPRPTPAPAPKAPSAPTSAPRTGNPIREVKTPSKAPAKAPSAGPKKEPVSQVDHALNKEGALTRGEREALRNFRQSTNRSGNGPKPATQEKLAKVNERLDADDALRKQSPKKSEAPESKQAQQPASTAPEAPKLPRSAPGYTLLEEPITKADTTMSILGTKSRDSVPVMKAAALRVRATLAEGGVGNPTAEKNLTIIDAIIKGLDNGSIKSGTTPISKVPGIKATMFEPSAPRSAPKAPSPAPENTPVKAPEVVEATAVPENTQPTTPRPSESTPGMQKAKGEPKIQPKNTTATESPAPSSSSEIPTVRSFSTLDVDARNNMKIHEFLDLPDNADPKTVQAVLEKLHRHNLDQLKKGIPVDNREAQAIRGLLEGLKGNGINLKDPAYGYAGSGGYSYGTAEYRYEANLNRVRQGGNSKLLSLPEEDFAPTSTRATKGATAVEGKAAPENAKPTQKTPKKAGNENPSPKETPPVSSVQAIETTEGFWYTKQLASGKTTLGEFLSVPENATNQQMLQRANSVIEFLSKATRNGVDDTVSERNLNWAKTIKTMLESRLTSPAPVTTKAKLSTIQSQMVAEGKVTARFQGKTTEYPPSALENLQQNNFSGENTVGELLGLTEQRSASFFKARINALLDHADTIRPLNLPWLQRALAAKNLSPTIKLKDL